MINSRNLKHLHLGHVIIPLYLRWLSQLTSLRLPRSVPLLTGNGDDAASSFLIPVPQRAELEPRRLVRSRSRGV